MKLEKITHLRLVRVSGEDTKTFLQGQLSNDINALEGAWQFSAYCNPKGRALATFIVWESLDAIYILCEETLIETVIKRLRMYVMRSKVVFEEIEANILGVFDQESIKALVEQYELGRQQAERKARFHTTLSDNVDILSFGERSMVIDKALSLLEQDAEQIVEQNGHQWIDADVSDALPRVTNESTEMFIPQMLNMDLVNGISFKKGCYTGQEIIARMHYLGKLKQRGFVCKILGDTNVSIGDKILDANGKSAGNVANLANSIGDTRLAFAVLRQDLIGNDSKDSDGESLNSNKEHDQSSQETLFLDSGAKIEVLTKQPYEFPQ